MNPQQKIGLVLVSGALISAVSMLEGTRYVPYDDVAHVLTVCQGYAGKDVVRNKTYTAAECAYLTQTQLQEHGAAVLRCTRVPLTQYQYDAFTLFTYNVGSSAFCQSSLLKKLNQGDYTGACNGLLAWDMAGGKHLAGLARRRVYEQQICLGKLATGAPLSAATAAATGGMGAK